MNFQHEYDVEQHDPQRLMEVVSMCPRREISEQWYHRKRMRVTMVYHALITFAHKYHHC